ncbi:MAG TPA: PIN domain-containing protein [Egibacteraceae bacterium]|nr:PIN domain-containing protein [Actinomycetota bacterium]HWB71918.1 PIN domain-containing protein [Egibacteraceae bacterium]
MADYLVDTDIFVDHLRGAARLPAEAREASYSVVTRCELFAGKHTAEEVVTRLLAPLRELLVDRAVAEQAGRLRRARPLRTPDALIAGTALVNRLTLLTRNLRDFHHVPELDVRTPG